MYFWVYMPFNNILSKKKSLHRHNPGNKERHTVPVEPHRVTTEYIILKCPNMNPLHPNISLHILLTVL